MLSEDDELLELELELELLESLSEELELLELLDEEELLLSESLSLSAGFYGERGGAHTWSEDR